MLAKQQKRIRLEDQDSTQQDTGMAYWGDSLVDIGTLPLPRYNRLLPILQATCSRQYTIIHHKIIGILGQV